MENDPWVPPYSIKIMHDFLDSKYYNFLNDIIQNRDFYKARQGVGSSQMVDERHKIRLDYTLTSLECSKIDKPLINKADCNCTLRERWRLLYYDGDTDKKAFRDAHTDWTRHSCHRRMSIIIGLSEPHEYEGGELVFPNDNLQYKIGKGCAVIFDGRLLHEVLPVTKGKRYVLQAFLFDETGWALKKTKNNYNSFILLGNDEDNNKEKLDKTNIKDENWEIYDNINAVHSRISSYEENYIGTFKYISDVLSSLKYKNDKICFTWHKPTHPSSKWRGRLYAWDEKTAKIKNRNDEKLWPKENNTLSGKIKSVIDKNINFEIKEIDTKKHLTIISTDGGPGNQIVGIKEGLIIAEILNRELIFPPIIQHYILNKVNRGGYNELKYWNFTDIFNYDNNENINELIDNIEFIENNSSDIYCVRQQDINKPLRMENLLNKKFNKMKIKRNRFSNVDDIKSLNYDDNNLIISHLYNVVQISKCYWNGCDICDVNPNLIDLYKKICSKFDYCDNIKSIGDKFIKENLSDNFIALHLRYHDVYNQNIKDVNKLYDESDIKILLDKLKGDQKISVFIATNNQKRILESELKDCKMLPLSIENDELESFIEQYICCRSNKFLYSGGIHAKPDHVHLRSTWSSFVLDYRYCILNKESSNNIYLSNYFSDKEIKSGYKY